MTSIAKFATAAVAAAGIAFAPMPAAADTEDLAKALVGLAVLGAVAKAVDNRNDRRESQKAQTQNTWRYDDRFRSIEEPFDGRVVRGELRRLDDQKARKGNGYKKHNPLPDRCLLVLDADRGRDRLVYGERCLERSYKFANKLPEQCKTLVRTDRGRRVVYGARCLERDGWRVARR